MNRRFKNQSRHGVTLIEMLVVISIIGIMSAITYPSITAGLDSLRLNTAADDVASLFTNAANQAQRKQQWVEIRVAAHRIEAIGVGIDRAIDLKEITASPEQSVFIDPIGTLPGAVVDLRGTKGAARRVRIDPITGVPEVQDVPAEK